ncbi:MAG: septal ring lytic transglycosylase RlpA family protein [Saprospiraceae bacterium]|nr:septal ring lytic transglycosylase RlpA family protein [Saprospiraceae bacterium]MCB9322489.1 septal ring lytic transglycosylase RlpA family protein [Lewinellaceae bacterium]
MNKILSFSLVVLFSMITFSSFAQSEELGLASYYGDKFQGSKTSYGDTYDRNEFTCAHKRHKYGTKLKVTRIDNKKSVVVKVIDKGPFVKGRVVDLSYAAAEKIGLIQDGVAEVKVEVVGSETTNDENTVNTSDAKAVTTKIVTETVRPDEFDAKSEPKSTQDPVKEKATAIVAKTEAKAEVKTTKDPQAAETFGFLLITETAIVQKAVEKGVYQVSLPGSVQQYGVQVASFSEYENAMRQLTLLKEKSFDKLILLTEAKGEGISYKVMLGPFDGEDSAKAYQESLAKKYKMKGFVVDLPVESTTTVKSGEPTVASAKSVILESPTPGDYGVQVASLESFDAALRQVDILKAKWFKDVLVKVEADGCKVILGPMADEASAKVYQASLKKKHKMNGFVVKLTE